MSILSTIPTEQLSQLDNISTGFTVGDLKEAISTIEKVTGKSLMDRTSEEIYATMLWVKEAQATYTKDHGSSSTVKEQANNFLTTKANKKNGAYHKFASELGKQIIVLQEMLKDEAAKAAAAKTTTLSTAGGVAAKVDTGDSEHDASVQDLVDDLYQKRFTNAQNEVKKYCDARDTVSKRTSRVNLANSSASQLVRQLTLSSGPKDPTDSRLVLEPVWTSLSADVQLSLYLNYKKFSCDHTKTMDTVQDSVGKALRSMGRVEKAEDLIGMTAAPADRKLIPIWNYIQNAKGLVDAFKKFKNVHPNVNWDALGFIIGESAIDVRAMNRFFKPRDPKAFYSKAYFLRASFVGGYQEITSRYIMAVQAIKACKDHLVNTWENQWDENTKVFNKTIDLDAKSDPIAAVLATKVVMDNDPAAIIRQAIDSEIIDDTVEEKLVCYLESGLIIDIKALTQTADFKISRRKNVAAHAQMKKLLAEYMVDVIRFADYAFKTNKAASLESMTMNLSPQSDTGKLYYSALRSLRIVLRSIKNEVFGKTVSNQKANAEDLFDLGVTFKEIKTGSRKESDFDHEAVRALTNSLDKLLK